MVQTRTPEEHHLLHPQSGRPRAGQGHGGTDSLRYLPGGAGVLEGDFLQSHQSRGDPAQGTTGGNTTAGSAAVVQRRKDGGAARPAHPAGRPAGQQTHGQTAGAAADQTAHQHRRQPMGPHGQGIQPGRTERIPPAPRISYPQVHRARRRIQKEGGGGKKGQIQRRAGAGTQTGALRHLHPAPGLQQSLSQHHSGIQLLFHHRGMERASRKSSGGSVRKRRTVGRYPGASPGRRRRRGSPAPRDQNAGGTPQKRQEHDEKGPRSGDQKRARRAAAGAQTHRQLHVRMLGILPFPLLRPAHRRPGHGHGTGSTAARRRGGAGYRRAGGHLRRYRLHHDQHPDTRPKRTAQSARARREGQTRSQQAVPNFGTGDRWDLQIHAASQEEKVCGARHERRWHGVQGTQGAGSGPKRLVYTVQRFGKVRHRPDFVGTRTGTSHRQHPSTSGRARQKNAGE
mmetsp:Transcript_39120/g.91114  ORF Transcript_39120/g.91114 Transcript_39120/m.91114 type:complete len:454 (-) Transcript_39120:1106-2467(-)